MDATAITIKKGHRLRVEVSSSSFPKYTRNPPPARMLNMPRSSRRSPIRSTTRRSIRRTSRCRFWTTRAVLERLKSKRSGPYQNRAR
ncbi:MAG: CocE/NonD family hydrolase C-terminal non-catalytic domain-containing protein [Planctomycetota bacterium]